MQLNPSVPERVTIFGVPTPLRRLTISIQMDADDIADARQYGSFSRVVAKPEIGGEVKEITLKMLARSSGKTIYAKSEEPLWAARSMVAAGLQSLLNDWKGRNHIRASNAKRIRAK